MQSPFLKKEKITLCKTCITSIFMNLVPLDNLLNLLSYNAKISICSKVDKMYLLLYWVTYKENKRKFTLRKTCIFKTIPSICTNLVSLESLLNLQLDNTKISIFSKVRSTFCCIGSQLNELFKILTQVAIFSKCSNFNDNTLKLFCFESHEKNSLHPISNVGVQ